MIQIVTCGWYLIKKAFSSFKYFFIRIIDRTIKSQKYNVLDNVSKSSNKTEGCNVQYTGKIEQFNGIPDLIEISFQLI